MNRERAIAGGLAGLAGGAAFAAFMKIDIAISGDAVDDFKLLGGFGPMRAHWRVIGPLIHAFNSASLGVAYGHVDVWRPSPGWLRGLVFALTENALLWPIIIVLDRVHPAIRSGTLPTFNRPWPFVAENLRHAAYGIVLGAMYERLWRRVTTRQKPHR
ncbi:MAG: hypothetical protein WEC79_03025 [Thermomicrobiales bacterium]